VYPEYQGTLLRINVRKGQRVSKGQTLAVIDDGGLSSQLAQLQTQEALAQTTFERQERLWSQEIGSEIQFLQTKAQYESAQNAVKQMKSQLAEVPETYLKTITKGKDVTVYFPVLDETIKATIKQKGNHINPTNRSFPIEVTVPNKKGLIKPNLTARLLINDYTSKKAILIPLSIINENAAGEQYVYIAFAKAKDNTIIAKQQIITTGKSQGDSIEILSGLKSGDQIIVEGARSVKDNQEVRILTY